MTTLHFSTEIAAPQQKVWDVLWNDKTYREWTSVFSEGSYAVTDWEKGSRILFLSGNEGMFSEVAEKIPQKFMSVRHLGTVKDGVEQPIDETAEWYGAFENYTLEQEGEMTKLTVDIDVSETEVQLFNDVFPKALEKVKALSE